MTSDASSPLTGHVLFTVRLAPRARVELSDHVAALRVCLRRVMARHPFQIDSGVVLPDRMHMIWRLPPNADAQLRWRLVKSGLSRHLRRTCPDAVPARAAGARDLGLWLPGQGARQVRGQADLDICRQVIWASPVVAGLVRRTTDWPHSSVHRHADRSARAGVAPPPRRLRPDLPRTFAPEASAAAPAMDCHP